MKYLTDQQWESFKKACLNDGVLIERVIKSFYRRALQADDIAIDVGAHVGYHTTGLAEKLINGIVVACEANPSTYLKLLKSLSGIRTSAPVLTINAAIQNDSSRQTITFNVSEEHPGRSGILQSWNSVHYEKRTVTARTLDDIVAALDLPKVNFIKCDVEGTEFEVFMGAKNLLSKFKPTIILEHGDREQQEFKKQWLTFFSNLGLEPFFPNGEPITESNFSDFWYAFLFPKNQIEGMMEHLKAAVVNWETM